MNLEHLTPEEQARYARLKTHAFVMRAQAARYEFLASCVVSAAAFRRFVNTLALSQAADDIASADHGEFENRVTDLLERP